MSSDADAEKVQIENPSVNSEEINADAVQLAMEDSEDEAVNALLEVDKKSEALSYVEPPTPSDASVNEKVESVKNDYAQNGPNEVEEEKQIEQNDDKVVKTSQSS